MGGHCRVPLGARERVWRPSPSGAASVSVDPSGDGALVAAVSVDDLRRLLEDVLEASEDRLALIAWLDRPVDPGHMRVFAVSGGDIRAGQFTCGRPRAAAPPHRLN